jgi:pescadillo protein
MLVKKKGKAGAASNYITRTRAIRKLQLSLPEFRRLCILKGIYPREPKNKKKASGNNNNNNTFYYTKDINYLLHETLVDSFREQKTFERKLRKAIGKNQESIVKMMEGNKPTYSLDHIVRERYPTFNEALDDLDDCISHIALFSTLPVEGVNLENVEKSQKLFKDFEKYVMHKNCLKKSFLSIKGIYYQAEINSKKITWLVPYQFTPKISVDVDFKVMLTFLEFYQTLLSFVLFRLYSDCNIKYNPKEAINVKDESEDEAESCLLFNHKTFYLSREVPTDSLTFLLKSLGAKVKAACWMEDENDSQINYQIVDRPTLQNMVYGRIYIQPQYVYDCLNSGEIIDPAPYAPGVSSLPAHLSPFVEYGEGDYNPSASIVNEKTETIVETPVDEETKNNEKEEMSKMVLSKKHRKVVDKISKAKEKKKEMFSKLQERRISKRNK